VTAALVTPAAVRTILYRSRTTAAGREYRRALAVLTVSILCAVTPIGSVLEDDPRYLKVYRLIWKVTREQRTLAAAPPNIDRPNVRWRS